MKKITLSNGYEIPVIALGTWEAEGEKGYEAVLCALQNGYDHIDTASAYNNETEVGQAIAASGRKREELFITSKLWNDVGTYEDTIKAFEDSLKRLGLAYLDLYLIHWPSPSKFRDNWAKRNEAVWSAMEDLYKQGKIKSIGVSNFTVEHLKALKQTWTIKPMINQIRLCPGDTKEELVQYCRAEDIALEAYSPFARGEVFKSEVLKDIADSYHKTIGQVIIRWCYQNGWIALPKSITPERIKSNIAIFDFVLSKSEMNIIKKVHTNYDFNSNNTNETKF